MKDDSKLPDLSEILASDLRAFVNDILHQDGGIDHFRQLLSDDQLSKLESRRKLELVTRAGVIFTRERNISNILETTLNTARNLTNSDGGSIYILEEIFADNPIDPGEVKSRNLKFVALQNETMKTSLKGEGIDIMPPVPLEVDGKPNLVNVSSYCAITGEMLRFDDVYDAEGFDFSGTSSYDEANDYRSQSMLVIPLEDHENRIIGVLQLINRRLADGSIGGFTEEDVELVQSVSYPAAASITQQRLIDEQANLFNAFVTMLAQGLGEKSPHTYNHIRRVAALGEAISASVSKWDEGIYADVKYNSEDLAEIRLAGWMHDVGKITTPEHIVSKQVKLQVVMDRFELIVERFNSKIKDYKIEMLQQLLVATKNDAPETELNELIQACEEKTNRLASQLEALFKANRGSESIPTEQVELIETLASETVAAFFKTEVVIDHGFPLLKSITREHHEASLINDGEKANLLIDRGTLSPEEREQIKLHADRSWRWLMALPFPRNQKRLPLYAGAHHEHLDGSGYPNGIEGKDMPLQARILAIADIYEALVANDRPYKSPMPLSQAMSILGNMVKRGALDGELMRIFLQSGDYLKYANEYLDAEQIDEVDIDEWMETYYVEPSRPK